jgi:hypothetical protein
MQPMYVNELFQLLEFIGVDWKVVGKHLGAPRTPLTLWRYGRRPIAKAYAAPFLRFTIEAVDQALAKAKAEDRVTHTGSLLSMSSTAVDFEAEVRDFVARWERELVHTTGEIDRDIQKWLNVLLEYRQQEASKQPAFDLQRAFFAAKRLQRGYGELLRHKGLTEELEVLEGFQRVGFNHDYAQSPADRIRELARWLGVDLETDA